MVDAMDVDTKDTTATPVVKTLTKAEIARKKAEDEAAAPPVPDLSIAQEIFKLSVTRSGGSVADASAFSASAKSVQASLLKFKAVGIYKALGEMYKAELNLPLQVDASAVATMTKENEAEKAVLLAAIETAKESAGEMEILDGNFALARFYSSTGLKTEAFAVFDDIIALPKISSGKKLDAMMEKARAASFHEDSSTYEKIVAQAVALASDGGDWDRKNRLKMYDAICKIANRDFKGASELLKDCIQTYSCTELCSYEDFVLYAVVTNILHMKRPELKKKIIDGPEVLAVINEKPALKKLVASFYDCDYKSYMSAMVDVAPILLADRFLNPHTGYIMRELHVMGYKQFLDSYKSVQLTSMAATFGLSVNYLDLQLSRFIAAGRLNAKIDKVAGVVETNRPDVKNAQYIEIVKKGDLLLNKIQKLARVVDV